MIAVLDNTGTVTEAIKQWRSREVFPVDLSSEEILGFSRELRMRSVFSARTTNAEYLQEIADTVDGMLSGKFAMAEGRYRLFRKLKQLGYDPEIGFPGDMANIPPAERGSLQDLSSDARLNLVLETNMLIAANYGRMIDGNRPYARHAYPAWELVRLFQRNVPRGTPESHTAGWQARWQDAGDAVGWVGAVEAPARRAGGPMIARKDSPIWQSLGNGAGGPARRAGGYTDTLSNPFPPFAFNSGMAWKSVGRKRCLELGLIAGDEVPEEMKGHHACRQAGLAPGAKEVNDIFERLSPDLEEELRRELADDKEEMFLRKAHAAHVAKQEAKVRDGIARRVEIREAGKKMVEAWMA